MQISTFSTSANATVEALGEGRRKADGHAAVPTNEHELAEEKLQLSTLVASFPFAFASGFGAHALWRVTAAQCGRISHRQRGRTNAIDVRLAFLDCLFSPFRRKGEKAGEETTATCLAVEKVGLIVTSTTFSPWQLLIEDDHVAAITLKGTHLPPSSD